MPITFKNNRLRDEFAQLQSKNKKLFQVLVDLEYFVHDMYNKDVVLTSVYRSKEENDALYKDTPLAQRPKAAPHTTWEATDIRSSLYSTEEIQGILGFLNKRYKNANGKPVAFCHAVAGNAMHFHIGIQLP